MLMEMCKPPRAFILYEWMKKWVYSTELNEKKVTQLVLRGVCTCVFVFNCYGSSLEDKMFQVPLMKGKNTVADSFTYIDLGKGQS